MSFIKMALELLLYDFLLQKYKNTLNFSATLLQFCYFNFANVVFLVIDF